MKQYYQTYNPITSTIEIWAGDSTKSNFLLTLSTPILPLGARKPKNVSRETIYTF